MDFFAHQESARKRTRILILLYVLAVITIIAFVNIAVISSVYLGVDDCRKIEKCHALFSVPLILFISAVTLAVIMVGTLYKIATLRGGGEHVARMLGGRLLTGGGANLHEQRLLNVVEEMALASGVPVPPVYLMDSEDGVNAFAAGFSPKDAVIGVTRGTMHTLSRDQLQGVIAHEFSHILNGDMRLNIRLIGVLHGILLIALIGRTLAQTGNNSSSNRKSKDNNFLPFLGFVLMVVGAIGVFFGRLIKAAVSRQREFLADAAAVQFTRNPSGIAGALKKIGGLDIGSEIEHRRAEEASHMFFSDGMIHRFTSLLATHPPLGERIRRIDSSFDGDFPDVEESYDGLAEDLTSNLSRTTKRPVATPQKSSTEAAIGDTTRIFDSLDRAREILDGLPAQLHTALRDPEQVSAVIIALTLDSDESARNLQLAILQKTPFNEAAQEFSKLLKSVNQEWYFPIVEIALPVVRQLSASRTQNLTDLLSNLAQADRRLTLFEYATVTLIRTVADRSTKPFVRTRYKDVSEVKEPIWILLSALAHQAATDQETCRRSYERSAGLFDIRDKCIAPEDCGLGKIDRALRELERAAPLVKKRVIEGLFECASADGNINVSEYELLRVISAVLDAPLPLV